MDQQTLGKKLKQFWEKSGLTQEEVEKALGLPQKAFTHIESGARKVSTLELAKFSELFHVPISDFFTKEIQEEDLLVTLHRNAYAFYILFKMLKSQLNVPLKIES